MNTASSSRWYSYHLRVHKSYSQCVFVFPLRKWRECYRVKTSVYTSYTFYTLCLSSFGFCEIVATNSPLSAHIVLWCMSCSSCKIIRRQWFFSFLSLCLFIRVAPYLYLILAMVWMFMSLHTNSEVEAISPHPQVIVLGSGSLGSD